MKRGAAEAQQDVGASIDPPIESESAVLPARLLSCEPAGRPTVGGGYDSMHSRQLHAHVKLLIAS
jgi:hypothetical protein